MADRKMVVDTGVFIEFLQASDKSHTTLHQLPDDAALVISAITLYELNMAATTREKLRDVQILTKDLTVLPFTEDVAINAAKIFRNARCLSSSSSGMFARALIELFRFNNSFPQSTPGRLR